MNDWNSNLKVLNNDEINCRAVEGDIILNIGGYLFLVQRKNDYNNVVFVADNPKIPICTAFKECLDLLRNVYCIQYVRVEGRLSRYKYLGKMLNVDCVQDNSKKDRRVLFLRLY